jgi:hypothetical protein
MKKLKMRSLSIWKSNCFAFSKNEIIGFNFIDCYYRGTGKCKSAGVRGKF